MCDVLQVSRSGFYAWRKRPASDRIQHHAELISEMKQIHSERHKDVYGSPRMHQELIDRGFEICEATVAKLMRNEGLAASTHRRFRVRTTDSNHRLPVAENTVDREFERHQPNEVWVSDLTYIPTKSGWLYLVVIIDLYSRKVVGWSMDVEMTTDVFLSALQMALGRRGEVSGLTHHSDRGSQYCSHAFQLALRRNRIDCSMSRKGNCWDNAVAESFFATLKKELVHQSEYADQEAARASVFEYIEVFYNRIRRHSFLGGMSPEQYEEQA
jgi:transposase InsO family protein